MWDSVLEDSHGRLVSSVYCTVPLRPSYGGTATYYPMIADKLFNTSQSHFLHLKNWYKNSAYFMVLFWGLNDIIYKDLT